MISKEIKILSFSFFIIFFAYNGVQQFLTSYFSEQNAIRIGFWSLILIYSSLLITNFFSGFIVSKFGVKKCLIFGSVFYSLFIFSIISHNLFLIYLASVLLGFGASILWTAQGTFLVRSCNSSEYGKNSGFFSTFFQLGSVFGIMVVSLLITRLSFDYSFLLIAVFPLISTVLFTTLKNTESQTVDLKEKFNAFKRMLTNTYALRFALIWLSFSFVLASVVGQIPLEIKKYFNLSLFLGLISSIFYFLPIAFSYYFGKKSDIRGRGGFLILSHVLVALGFGLFVLQANYGLNKWFFILCFLMISFGYAIFASIRFAFLGDAASRENLEYLTALTLLFGNVGYVIVFLMNIYLPPVFSYLLSFAVVFLSLIITLPILRLNIGTLKEKVK